MNKRAAVTWHALSSYSFFSTIDREKTDFRLISEMVVISFGFSVIVNQERGSPRSRSLPGDVTCRLLLNSICLSGEQYVLTYVRTPAVPFLSSSLCKLSLYSLHGVFQLTHLSMISSKSTMVLLCGEASKRSLISCR